MAVSPSINIDNNQQDVIWEKNATHLNSSIVYNIIESFSFGFQRQNTKSFRIKGGHASSARVKFRINV
eukprot:9902240-Karenia_brevis.AAC.1